MISWSLKVFRLKELKKYPKNPRYLTKEQHSHLKTSLDKFGLIEKPIINLDNMIISGHQRINIMLKKGIQSLECWFPDRLLTDEEVEECVIRMNRNTGSFDFEMLANEFDIQKLLTFGFTPEDFELSIDLESEPKKKKEKICPHCGEKI